MGLMKTIFRSPAIMLGTFTLLILGLLLKSARDHSVQEIGGCRMTYSAPNYHEIKLKEVSERGYKLFLFRDGQFDSDQLHGTPVLFIHGNAGSYKQVRSLAKVSSERAYYSEGPGLDFFSADFQEEFSALTGELLSRQAEFINSCIGYILDIYKKVPGKGPAPTSVLVIGHSMGGMVARGAMGLSNYKLKSINTIITLSTPHTDARVPLEKGMWDFYRNMNEFWTQNFNSEGGKGPLEGVSLISLNGGDMDGQISADLTEVSALFPREHGFTVFSTTLPKCWVSVEHQVILWCNQVVNSIVGAIHGVIKPSLPSRTLPLEERMSVFSQQFLELPPLPSSVEMNRSYVSKEPGHFVISKLTDNIALNLKQGLTVTSSASLMIYACKSVEGSLKCKDMSLGRTMIPASDHRTDPEFGDLVYYFWEVQENDSILFIEKPKKSSNTDFFRVENLIPSTEYHPSYWDLVRGFRISTLSDKVVHWQYRLPDSPLLSYTLKIETSAAMPFILQQASSLVNERKVWISSTDDVPIHVNFHGIREGRLVSFWRGVTFRLWPRMPSESFDAQLETIEIVFQLNVYGTLGRLLKRIDLAAVVIPFVVLLFIFRFQLQRGSQTGGCSSFLAAHKDFVQFELKYWLLLLSLLPVAQNICQSSAAVALNSPCNTRNWLLGSWGMAVAWMLPLVLLLATGWVTILFVFLSVLELLLRPLSWIMGKLHSKTKWFLWLLLAVPHPIVHVVALLAAIMQLQPKMIQSSRYNIQVTMTLLLITSLLCHLPWLIVFFQSIAKGIHPDVSFHFSHLLSIPLILDLTHPLPLAKLHDAISRPSLALFTQSLLITASLAVLIWGVHAAFIIPYVNVAILAWLRLISFLIPSATKP